MYTGVVMVQGPNGPVEGKRPPAEILQVLSGADGEPFGWRRDLGFQLAAAGFSIDEAVDVWSIERDTIMRRRREMGYTWDYAMGTAPSIRSAPGIRYPGIPMYDPDHPPLGAILIPDAKGMVINTKAK